MKSPNPFSGGGRRAFRRGLRPSGGCRRDQEVPRARRRRDLRRGGAEVEAEAEVPVVLVRGLRLRRLHARGPPRLVVRPVRPEVQLAHWDRLSRTRRGRSGGGWSSYASCASTCSSTPAPSSAASPTRRPGSGATGSWPPWTATRTGSCWGARCGSTRCTSLTPTSRVTRVEAGRRGLSKEQDLHRRGESTRARTLSPSGAGTASRPAKRIKEGPAPAHRRGLGDLPRHGEVPQVAGRGGAGHRPALQGPTPGDPGVP